MSYVANYPGIFVILAISCLARVNGSKHRNCFCGVHGNYQDRILGGSDVVPHEYPWIVAVLYRNLHRCGGSLISRQYVLTACHCVRNIEMSEITIGVEEHIRESSGGIRVKISKIIKHEKCEFNGMHHVFDIALVKLKRPVKFSKILSPICLPNPAYQNYEKPVTVLGWGQMSYKGDLAEVLQKVEVNLFTYDDCAENYRKKTMTDYLICALAENRDACKGDSGGPLMYEYDEGKWELVGIIAWGETCKPGSIPGMYTNVSYFLDWIDRHTPDAKYCNN